jgi:YidC/Oxa1 family membrane protein insertase
MKQQQRFMLALAASAAVLIAWNYIFPPPTPPPPDPNANQQVAQSSPQASQQSSQTPSAQPTAQATATANASATPAPAQVSASPTPAPTPDVPQRKIRVVTPLYEATFDTRGAIATNWIITRNKNTGREIHAASTTKNNPTPLELIPATPAGIDASKLMHALQVITGDAATDAALAGKNAKVSGGKSDSGDEVIHVESGSKQLDFLIHDDATGLDAKKTITFFADRYSADVQLNLTRYGQPQADPKLVIGPSIGDQGIDAYTFYLYPPEGIAVVNGEVRRVLSTEIHSDRQNTGTINWMLEGIGLKSVVKKPADHEPVPGAMQWGGVGDTYFGMIAVPSRPTSGLEFRTVRYEHKTNGSTEERFLVTGLVPIPADGTKTELYVGPKDHSLLAQASQQIKQNGGPQVDLGEAINYGFLAGMRRFLAVPILVAINALQRMTNSYGVAIILFTILIYSLFFPLKWQSSRKMKKAQKYAPRMKELQEKLKGMKQNDPRMKELQMEQLRLMKEANPLGGCLPLLIQMPFLFALYTALTISIDFRQAQFLWIPDLSGPEPYLLGFIRTLPLLFTGSMIVLQLLTPAPSADPLQRKMMAIGMPLFMLYILWSAPSGLLLYWLVGNIVGFSQQLIINRLTKEEEPPPDEKGVKKKPAKKLKPAEA